MVGGAVVQLMKDILFPYECVDCGKEGEWWCKSCRTDLNIKKWAADELTSVTALFNYEEKGNIGRLIKRFKYSQVSDLSELWRGSIAEAKLVYPSGSVVIPVPLHQIRFRERGYNQAQILAEILVDCLGKEVVVDSDNLFRVKRTKQQAKLGAEERQINVKDAFLWKGGKAPKMVILVDDVYTTGATMRECARVLKRAGVEEVCGFVLAHG